MICACCGDALWPGQNVSEGEVPYPHDQGYGLCAPCDEWGDQVFYETRIERVKAALKPENAAKFDKMSTEAQRAFVARAIERGLMI